MKKFILCCRFYAKNVIKFDIYQGRVTPNCFKSHTKSWYANFFQKKKSFANARSENKVVRRNIFSTGWSARASKKLYQAWNAD